MTGVLLWLIRWAPCAGTRDFCSALAALVSPVQFFFLTTHYCTSFVPYAQQAEQAVVPRRPSINLSLWYTVIIAAHLYLSFC
jgi:hypothetical protein